jgi:pyruvate/2-oxoglutarate dehydrogenase complex dihydrolipoamide dehydrogenase (E3) component
MKAQRFDAIVVGAGQAGPPLAGRLARAGMTVAIVERDQVGGTCVNTGCMPTKTLVASARAAHVARRAADFGVVLEAGVRVDMPRVKARADRVAASARSNLEHWIVGNDRCSLVRGHGRFESPRVIRVGDRLLTAERIFLDVGARPAMPPLSGIERARPLTSTTILALSQVPRHLVVVGGGYVGLEFAQMYRRFGSEVTIVERGPHVLGQEDVDVSEGMEGIMEAEGIQVRRDAECISFPSTTDGEVTVDMDCSMGERQVRGTHCLLAVGRVPNTHDLGLDRAGVAVDEKGFVIVDDELKTSAEGIWALGECNGHGAFTHTAYNDYEIVAATLLDGEHRRLHERIKTYAVFIDPPLGRVGMTEREARATGRPILMGKRPMSRVGRAIEKDETQGFIKILVDAKTGDLVGAAILGIGGDEVVHGIIDVMSSGGNAESLRRTVGIHPTVSELLPTVLGDLKPLPP